MELPQPCPFKTQGGYLETHDFLQPLERIGKNVPKEGNKIEEQVIPKPNSLASPSRVEHILPCGIGSYSIRHISPVNQSRKMSRPEVVDFTAAQTQCSGESDKNDESSNGSSYKGSGFSLWEESGVKKGKTRKENIAGNKHGIIEGAMQIGGVPWRTSMERPSPSSSAHNHPSTTISSLSSSHPPSAPKNPSFVDMLKSAKIIRQDDDDDEEEFVIKKEPSLHYKDTTHHDQKPNTPRSKHSATEQRRRSKINDRFCMLRELIPHVDQKRDKASFLLEVIEYIRFLQEKVHKYEDSWNNELPVTVPWNNNQRTTEGSIDQPQVKNDVTGPPSAHGAKLTENKCSLALNLLNQGRNILLDSDLSCSHDEPMKEIGQHNPLTNKTSPFNSLLQPNIYSPCCGSRSCIVDCAVAHADKLKDDELTIESGTISISSIYSKGLLSTLTQALQSSGVDLSQANISVQIDLAKRSNTTTHNSSIPIHKKPEATAIEETRGRSRLASSREEKNGKMLKRFKTSRN